MGNVQRMMLIIIITSDDNVIIISFFTTTSKIKNRCPGFWWNVFEIFFGGREEIVNDMIMTMS